jgi:hypothetical protein
VYGHFSGKYRFMGKMFIDTFLVSTDAEYIGLTLVLVELVLVPNRKLLLEELSASTEHCAT